MNNKKITKNKMKDFLKEKLKSSEKWMIGALMTVYNNQTLEEKNAEATIDHNGVGFSGVDAEILTSYTKQLKRKMAGNCYCGKSIEEPYQCKHCKRLLKLLSPKQMALMKIKMHKYWEQVLNAAKEKDNVETLEKLYWKEHPQTDLFGK